MTRTKSVKTELNNEGSSFTNIEYNGESTSTIIFTNVGSSIGEV